MRLPPLSLYMHLPWCVRKCPYCDFNSHTAGDSAPTTRYVDALLADLDRERARAGDRSIESIFLGGGTPSLFTPEEIGRLLTAIRERFAVAADVEITMEANPGTVESGSPAGYRDAGVNRLSIGAQSFNDDALKRLGRIHSSHDIHRTVDDVKAAGFDNFNLDLMHALPGQTVASAEADVRTAVALGPTHISWYQLTLEPNTVFHARPPEGLPNEELTGEIQDAGGSLLRNAGFEQYEVSAWARDGRRCRHNLNYWQFGDYLAVGAGAHGKLSNAQGVCRYRKPANPLQYMVSMEQKSERERLEPVPEDQILFEFMLNALRLADGFPESVFSDRTGLPAGVLAKEAGAAVEKGLLERDEGGTWRPTGLGWRFLNDLQAEFLRNS
ncbi:MAG: radical SAM family heme chaperone HemW [Gammaproteobacteria bacterium]|nr:radical SAM family heme chaperone HemW [Gammaproteobacteria bacterium]